jgi:hypothetical protein
MLLELMVYNIGTLMHGAVLDFREWQQLAGICLLSIVHVRHSLSTIERRNDSRKVEFSQGVDDIEEEKAESR